MLIKRNYLEAERHRKKAAEIMERLDLQAAISLLAESGVTRGVACELFPRSESTEQG